MLYILFLLSTGISATILAGLGIYGFTRRNVPAAKWFVLVMAVSFV